MVLITNKPPQAPSRSGFTVGANTGEFLDGVNGYLFGASIRRIDGISSYIV